MCILHSSFNANKWNRMQTGFVLGQRPKDSGEGKPTFQANVGSGLNAFGSRCDARCCFRSPAHKSCGGSFREHDTVMASPRSMAVSSHCHVSRGIGFLPCLYCYVHEPAPRHQSPCLLACFLRQCNGASCSQKLAGALVHLRAKHGCCSSCSIVPWMLER